jgi:hypothetical protein
MEFLRRIASRLSRTEEDKISRHQTKMTDHAGRRSSKIRSNRKRRTNGAANPDLRPIRSATLQKVNLSKCKHHRVARLLYLRMVRERDFHPQLSHKWAA